MQLLPVIFPEVPFTSLAPFTRGLSWQFLPLVVRRVCCRPQCVGLTELTARSLMNPLIVCNEAHRFW